MHEWMNAWMQESKRAREQGCRWENKGNTLLTGWELQHRNDKTLCIQR